MENQIFFGFYEKQVPREEVFEHISSGWVPLVNTLIDDLFKLGWNGRLIQIKEKFGGLRFYIGGGTEEIHRRIGKAENESFTICEKCGQPGSLRTDRSWMRSLCDEHAKGEE